MVDQGAFKTSALRLGAAAGLVALAAVAVLPSAFAAGGPQGGPPQGRQQQAAACENGPRVCGGAAGEGGVLTGQQEAALQFWAEEEKMAHDLYVAFADLFPELTQFDRVARSEEKHENQVLALLEGCGVAAAGEGLPAGQFSNPEVSAMYGSLLASGSVSAQDALAAGRAVEEQDLADLADLVELFDGEGKAAGVAESQIVASGRHLEAFSPTGGRTPPR